MLQAALTLFLYESMGVSLKRAEDLEGGLASALQKRHKIRDTNLKQLFELANKEEDMAWARIYNSLYLLTYAGAAYKNFENLFNAPKGSLGQVHIIPHWDTSQVIELASTYDKEPMNLFPGWSLSNTQNNNFILDPHVVYEELNGRLVTDLHGVKKSKNKKIPHSIQISKALYEKDAQATIDRNNNVDLHTALKRKRRNSGYTESLEEPSQALKKFSASIDKKNFTEHDKQEAINKFKYLKNIMKKTTDGGITHYTDLIVSVSKTLGIQHPAYAALTEAKNNWKKLRQDMLNYIEIECIEDLKKPGNYGDISMSLPHH